MRKLLDWAKNNYLLKAIFEPFRALGRHKVESFIWFMFVIAASQMGIIINIIYRWGFQGWGFKAALAAESSTGSFYTFCLVMIASILGPLFIFHVRDKEPKFRYITMVFVTILVFTMILDAIFYSFSSQTPKLTDFSKLANDNIVVDWAQLIFFVMAVAFATYSFGLSLIREHGESVGLEDKYLSTENNNKEKLTREFTSDSGAEDFNGIKV